MRPIFEETAFATDTFLQDINVYDRLVADYKKYGRLIVAFDYDDTISPNTGKCCDQVIELLQECSKIDTIDMIVFTVRNSMDYPLIRSYCVEHGIRCDAINENIPRMKDQFGSGFDSKMLYSVFLDDRAGLRSAYESLVQFLEWYYREVVE